MCYGTWHKLLTWLRSFLQFSCAGFLWKSAKSAAWPHPFHVLPVQILKAFWRFYACTYIHIKQPLKWNRDFKLHWFQMMLGSLFRFWSIKRHSLSKMICNLGHLKNHLRQTASQAFLDIPKVTFTFSPTPTVPSLMVLLFTNDIVPFERPSVRCTLFNTLVLGWDYVLEVCMYVSRTCGLQCRSPQEAFEHSEISYWKPLFYRPLFCSKPIWQFWNVSEIPKILT